jgi:hypothetical protein
VKAVIAASGPWSFPAGRTYFKLRILRKKFSTGGPLWRYFTGEADPILTGRTTAPRGMSVTSVSTVATPPPFP